jgi:cytochrome c biogenesis protein CcmG/thiol:disulfide interchange protein DsbE
MRVRGGALKWTGLGIAAAAVIFAVVLASRFGTDPGLVESPLLGEPAPTLELPMLDDSTTFATSDLTGSVTVVNFFASWCPECRAEHADLVATAEAFKDRGVQFVQISYSESREASNAYLDEAGRSESTIYLADPGSRAAIAYGVFGIPETFFLDASGTVVGKIIGEANAFILGATLDTILAGDVPGQKITGDTQQQPDE